jgi:DNA repair protein RadC
LLSLQSPSDACSFNAGAPAVYESFAVGSSGGSNTEMSKEHYHGHRQRIRERFQKYGLDSFQDYEVLELLLTFVARQQDMKPVAKALVDRFGSFKDILDAPVEELQTVEGIGPAAVTLIHLVKQDAARYLQQTSCLRSGLDSLDSLIQHCIVKLGAEPNERFRVICLDSNFAIITERDVAEGTVNQATVYPRKVMEEALRAKASTLVFVHNHPDGNVTPSEFDKTLTRNLVLAAKTMGISVYDHIIVSRDTHFSFREQNLL